MDIARQLEQVKLFRGLDMAALKTIAALTSTMDLADGEVLIEEGGRKPVALRRARRWAAYQPAGCIDAIQRRAVR